MTMNGAVLPVLAMYIVAAEEQGVDQVRFNSPLEDFWSHPWIQLPMAINVITYLVNLNFI